MELVVTGTVVVVGAVVVVVEDDAVLVDIDVLGAAPLAAWVPQAAAVSATPTHSRARRGDDVFPCA